jgi:hypothetical protein
MTIDKMFSPRTFEERQAVSRTIKDPSSDQTRLGNPGKTYKISTDKGLYRQRIQQSTSVLKRKPIYAVLYLRKKVLEK